MEGKVRSYSKMMNQIIETSPNKAKIKKERKVTKTTIQSRAPLIKSKKYSLVQLKKNCDPNSFQIMQAKYFRDSINRGIIHSHGPCDKNM